MLLAAAVLLGACSGRGERDNKSNATQLYSKARRAMEGGNYKNAITYYEGLEARFPFSEQSKQAQLDLIYCYYRNGETESAIDAANQFERENPSHPRVDYALYMRGLANFRGQSNGFFRFMGVDLSQRPPNHLRESFSAFAQLLQRHPKSPYAADARQRMIFLRNRLADYENNVANFYYRRGAYLAALNRAKYSLEAYNGATATPESLRIIIDSYRALGMTDLAESTRVVLAENYPQAATAQRRSEDKPWYRFW